MWPRTVKGEEKHKVHKRTYEIETILNLISDVIKDLKKNNISILEFGSGDGHHIPFLKRIGQVVASDIGIKFVNKDTPFVQCNIVNPPFLPNSFDIIFSNHVIEHIDDVDFTFEELKSIGKPNCIYAFSVPTAVWLLLSLPAHYYNKLRKLFFIIKGLDKDNSSKKIHKNLKEKSINSYNCVFLKHCLPSGHGYNSDFLSCFRLFRVMSWQKLFVSNGFSIIKRAPLLLYAPSEWPVVPTTKMFNRLGIYSSVLFLMKKK